MGWAGVCVGGGGTSACTLSNSHFNSNIIISSFCLVCDKLHMFCKMIAPVSGQGANLTTTS